MSLTTTASFIVRKLELNDYEEVRDICKEVEFIMAKYNNEVTMGLDGNAILVAQDLQTGKLLGVCSGINLTPELAFIGQYAVRPQYQGLGIGSTLWKKIMEHIGSERNISLFSLKEMFENYRNRSGFVVVPQKRLKCFMRKPNCDLLVKDIKGISLFCINEYNLKSVVEYDREVCDGLDRTHLIKEYSKALQTICLEAMNSETHKVMGYCITTATIEDIAAVEPLYADNQQIAELLVAKCCDSLSIAKTNGILFQCWDSHENAIQIADKMGLIAIKSAPILFTKQVIEGNIQKIFSLSNVRYYPF